MQNLHNTECNDICKSFKPIFECTIENISNENGKFSFDKNLKDFELVATCLSWDSATKSWPSGTNKELLHFATH